MLKRLLLSLGALLLALFAGAVYLTMPQTIPEESDFALDLEALRALATSLPGPLPQDAIGSELVAEGPLRRGAVFAGESLTELQPFVFQAFQVSYPSGAFVMIDAAFPERLMAEFRDGGRFRTDAFARVLGALPSADQIVVTHEHFDHLAGVGAVAEPEALVGRVRLTREQLENRAALDESAIPAPLRAAQFLSYDAPYALLPGIVLVKAPGHTPGSQLVYVRTQSGRELLFVGDVAWHHDQIARLHYRPRFMTDLLLGEDRKAVMAQIRALHDLEARAPELVVVVSHDPDQRARLLAEGVLRDGVVLRGPTPPGRGSDLGSRRP